jgi:hypothetical protein
MKLVVLIGRSNIFPAAPAFANPRKIRAEAGARIRMAWRMYNLRKYVRIIAFIKVRSSVGWRLTLWTRITKKRIAAKMICDLVKEVKKAGPRLLPIFQQIRYRVKTAQRMVRDYLVCKHTRLLMLGKKWDLLEKRQAAKLRSSTQHEFRERLKNSGGAFVKPGGILNGVTSLDRRLNTAGSKQVVFQTANQQVG